MRASGTQCGLIYSTLCGTADPFSGRNSENDPIETHSGQQPNRLGKAQHHQQQHQPPPFPLHDPGAINYLENLWWWWSGWWLVGHMGIVKEMFNNIYPETHIICMLRHRSTFMYQSSTYWQKRICFITIITGHKSLTVGETCNGNGLMGSSSSRRRAGEQLEGRQLLWRRKRATDLI